MKRLTLLLVILVSHVLVLASESKFVISRHQNTAALQHCANKVTKAYENLKIDFVLQEYPGRRSLHMANSGQTDAELCRIKLTGKRFTNLIRVEPAIHQLNFHAVTKNTGIKLTKVSDLNHLRIGSIRGMMAAELIFERQEVRYENSPEQTARLLNDNTVDVLVLAMPDIQQLVNNGHLKPEFVQPTPLYQLALFHFVHQKHKEIVPKLTEAFEQLITDQDQNN